MSTMRERLKGSDTGDLPAVLQAAGVSGAGGGGFPAYVKWQALDDVRHLLVNHQESEPNCYVDRWLGRAHADELATLFDALLEEALETVVVGAKHADRDPWLRPLERATDGTAYTPDQLPIDPEPESGVVFAYTDDTYEYGMETVLLRVTAGTVIGKDLPVDYGWVVQNTETLYNIARALADDDPVLRKFVHIDGFQANGDRLPHRLFDVPVGTPAATLLDAVGVDPGGLAEDRVLAEGGPGWCFKVQRPPDRYGVRKRTNCLLVLDEETVAANTYANGRVDVLDPFDWSLADPDTEPSPVTPDRVHVPTITNDEYSDVVAASTPVVELGDTVAKGELVAEAEPRGDGFCLAHRTPVAGRVADVTPREVEVHRR